MRDTRDELLSLALTSVKAIGFKLKLEIAEHAGVNEAIVRESFVKTGICSIECRFLNRFKTAPVERD